MKLIPLPAFQDNCLWFLHDGRRALAGDPGDAQPVAAALQREGLQQEAILVTHHHPDHPGDARERFPEPVSLLAEGDRIGETRVCCTHEYILGNPKFARDAEPGNLELINCMRRGEELRTHDLPTLPARTHDAAAPSDNVGSFATLREWKNEFR